MLIVISTVRYGMIKTVVVNEFNFESRFNDESLRWPQLAALALKDFAEGNLDSNPFDVSSLDDDDVVTVQVYEFDAGELSYRASASCIVTNNM